jgi:sugar phosphate isomerase/epimerase
MTPCISQVTTLPASFEDDLNSAVGAGFPAVEVWLTKLEQHLETHSALDAAKIVADSGLILPAASFQGGLLLGDSDRRVAHLDHFKRRLNICQAFCIPVLVLAPGFASSVTGASLAPAMKNLVEAARWADAFGVKLALEFHGGDAFCNNLDTALTLVEQCGEPNLGICLDAFHFHKGPSRTEDLARLTATNLFHVQLCDVAGTPREWMTDAERVLPGDGDFLLAPIAARLRAINYAGAVSLELMNPMLWSVDSAQVCEAGLRSLERFVCSS